MPAGTATFRARVEPPEPMRGLEVPEGVYRTALGAHVHAVETAKRPETRVRRIEKAVAALRDAGGER